MKRMGRRDFIWTAGIGGLATPYLLTSAAGRARAPRSPFAFRAGRDPQQVFGCSIASGDPTPSGVVLWTRINESVWNPDLELGFEVAADRRFRDLVLQGTISGEDVGPETDYTVHVDLDGQLDPDRYYYYRFVYDQTRSRPGRCRTLPVPGTPKESAKLALLTCQDFSNGYYGALTHVALDVEIDFVVHLGDFIYETTGGTAYQNRQFPDRGIELPSTEFRAFDLADFRALYRRYRSDRWFQMALEFHTWIVIWDDHETSNDCYWDYERDTLGAPDHPLQKDPAYGNDPVALRRLKLDAQQAWSEYVPTRRRFDPSASHPFDALQIYQRLQFGDLVDLFLTDERTYRTPHPCGERPLGDRLFALDCPERHAPAQSMLGGLQRDWLIEGMTQSRSLWQAWANEVFLGEISLGPAGPDQWIMNNDAWDGYEAERIRILSALREGGVRNLVALTGDLHTYMASRIKLDYSDRSNLNSDNVVGVEFMTPAVTSSNLVHRAGIEAPAVKDWGGDILNRLLPRYVLEPLVRSSNPHVRFFNSQDWGYSTIRFTRSYCEWTAYTVDKFQNQFLPPRHEIQCLRVPINTHRLDLGPIGAPG